MMDNVKIIPVWDKSNEEWLELRKGGIGGSDAGTICNVNKYNSPYALWSEKTGIVERTFEGNEATEWGNILERPIAEKYAKDYNVAVVEWPVIIWSERPGQEFMFANLDFLIVKPSEQFPAGVVSQYRNLAIPPCGIERILEVKTAGIASPGNPGAWANNQVPQSYMLQGYHYGVVTNVKAITFCALIGGQGIQVRNMTWDENIAENLIAAESMFWDAVTTLNPPPTDGSEATESAQSKMYPRHSTGKVYEGGSTLKELWAEFTLAKEASEDAERERKRLRAQILELVGDAEYATVDGQPLFSYRANKDSETFDSKKFQGQMPEIYAQFTSLRPGSRVLREIKN